MFKPLRLSDLSPGRQALVRLCETINVGSIENLGVRDSEPVFDPPPVMLRDLKLDSDEGSRPELALTDFVVSKEVVRLMGQLDEMKIGTFRRIEVRGGIPRRILLESQSLGFAVGLAEPTGDQLSSESRARRRVAEAADPDATPSGMVEFERDLAREGVPNTG